MQDFESFFAQRRQAAQAYVNGDAAPLAALAATEGPATFFGPGGGVIEGPEAVTERYVRDAGSFDSGSETTLEVLQMAADGDLGYWSGYQRARVRLKGRPEPVEMNLRVTEVFRREHGSWKLVQRHADMLTQAQPR